MTALVQPIEVLLVEGDLVRRPRPRPRPRKACEPVLRASG